MRMDKRDKNRCFLFALGAQLSRTEIVSQICAQIDSSRLNKRGQDSGRCMCHKLSFGRPDR